MFARLLFVLTPALVVFCLLVWVNFQVALFMALIAIWFGIDMTETRPKSNTPPYLD